MPVFYFFLQIKKNVPGAEFNEGVKINKLQVPEVIQHGEPVILDCDFTLEAADQDLVVKWFFNNKNYTLVYQWIPGESRTPTPLELGLFKAPHIPSN